MDENDLTFLSKIINPAYLNPANIAKIKTKFFDDSFIQLADFLNKETCESIEKLCLEKDQGEGIKCSVMTPYQTGVGHGWTVCGPPLCQRYLTVDETSQEMDQTAVKFLEIKNAFASPAFRRWLGFVSFVVPKSSNINTPPSFNIL